MITNRRHDLAEHPYVQSEAKLLAVPAGPILDALTAGVLSYDTR
jgi:hypothetical protein